ncbi:MAG: DUF4292 domain-containing protein [Bacteroidetes Order II. Incertae sedis bacterium]|nr:DUF4292 domain-containing protein [Bacteroidetes Order II. bacterium]
MNTYTFFSSSFGPFRWTPFLAFILLTGCKSAKPCIEPVYGAGTQSTWVKPSEPKPPIENVAIVDPPVTPPLPVGPATPPPQKSAEAQLAEETIARMEMARPKLNRLTATSSMDIDSPELEQSLTAHSRYESGKGLYTSYRATAINFEGARSLVTRDSFFVYNRIEKELTYGPISLANRFLPVSGTIEQIMAILTGSVVPENGFSWEAFQSGGQIVLRTTDLRQQFTVDARSYRVSKIELRNSKNELTEQILYHEPTTFGTLLIPRRVEMIQPLAKRTVKIYHRNFDLNPESLSFDLNIDRKKVKLMPVR